MRLLTLLRPEAVRANLAGNTVEKIVPELARPLAQALRSEDQALARAVSEGGQVDSVIVADGVGIVRCRVAGLPRMAASIGRSRSGVSLQSVDGAPVRLVVALFTPDGLGEKEGREGVRALGRLFRRGEFRQAVLDARDEDAMWQLLLREERSQWRKKEGRGWAVTIAAVVAFRSFLYEAVYIPSGSMIPTLQIGDYVVVEKWAYGARIPFTASAQVDWSSPRRGDIVVLLAPPGNPRSDDLIKRVVAVAGDSVEIRDGALWLNGEPVPRRALDGTCSYWDKVEGGSWYEEPCTAAEERLGDHLYRTYCTPDQGCGDVSARVVPPGTVWLAGDHRDHSADSRVFGPVPVGRIKGRAWVALASLGQDGIRWHRLFHRVSH